MGKKIKVLHLIHDLKKGGGERFALDVVKALQQFDNIEVKLGVCQPNNQYPELTDELPIEWLNSKYHPSIAGKTILDNEGYKRLVNEFQPDIIHTHLIRAELMSSTYIQKHVNYVTHCHDNMEEFENLSFKTFTTKRKITNFYEKSLLKKNKYKYVKNYFIANSNHTRQYFLKTVPKKYKNNVALIHCGFDFNRFHNSTVVRPKDKIRLINIGSFMTKKNQQLLVKVALELRKRNVDFELIMLGDGEHRNEIQNEVNKLNLNNKVQLKGIVHNVDEYLWGSNIYIHSAYYEPFGLVFLEAMAAGLPIVTLDGKGNRDLIQNGRNGYLIEDQNPVEFADKVLSLLKDEEHYNTISEYCVDYAKSFDLPNKTKELVEFYKEIMNK